MASRSFGSPPSPLRGESLPSGPDPRGKRSLGAKRPSEARVRGPRGAAPELDSRLRGNDGEKGRPTADCRLPAPYSLLTTHYLLPPNPRSPSSPAAIPAVTTRQTTSAATSSGCGDGSAMPPAATPIPWASPSRASSAPPSTACAAGAPGCWPESSPISRRRSRCRATPRVRCSRRSSTTSIWSASTRRCAPMSSAANGRRRAAPPRVIRAVDASHHRRPVDRRPRRAHHRGDRK
jgi:hypothetical protein